MSCEWEALLPAISRDINVETVERLQRVSARAKIKHLYSAPHPEIWVTDCKSLHCGLSHPPDRRLGPTMHKRIALPSAYADMCVIATQTVLAQPHSTPRPKPSDG